MKQTAKGRVTEEFLDDLERVACLYKKAWTMGVSSYTMKAIIEELRDLRSKTNGTT